MSSVRWGEDGRLHAHYLEFNIVAHCNFRCVYCSQYSPHNPKISADIHVFERDIAALTEAYHADVFRFVGGEPTLHQQLVDFVRLVKKYELADTVAVCTNGSILHQMSDAFFQAIDRLDISVYPKKLGKHGQNLELAEEKCRKHGTLIKLSHSAAIWGLNHIEQKNEDSDLVKRIYDSCMITHEWNCHTFYQGRYYKCSGIPFSVNYFKKMGVVPPDFLNLDGVPIHKRGNLANRLWPYINDVNPLEACKYCLGTVGRGIEWRELEGKDEIEKPLETYGSVSNLLDPAWLAGEAD